MASLGTGLFRLMMASCSNITIEDMPLILCFDLLDLICKFMIESIKKFFVTNTTEATPYKFSLLMSL